MLAVKGLPTKDHRAGGGLDPSSRARLLLGAAVCAVVATGIALPFPATSQTIPSTEAGQDSTTRQFNIPAQALSSALAQFGRQAGLQIAFAYETPSGMSSSPVSGTMSPQQALGQMLAGTGATWRIAQGTVVIELTREVSDPGMVDLEVGADTVMLGTIVISGRFADGYFNPETPYETPGSNAHITAETIERVAPISAGDVFRTTPGVIASGNRGTSIRPSIRGIEGEGRVKTTIDGAEGTISAYRGYAGNREETYLDPDLLAGVDITKGPDGGAIGGTVAFRTISAEDIVEPGQKWGVRLRFGAANNTVAPGPIPERLSDPQVLSDRPSFLSGNTWNGNIAAAFMGDRFEAVAAYSRRSSGNYFAGSRYGSLEDENARRTGTLIPAVNFGEPGEEVPNTSEDTTSLLAKGKLHWGDGQSLEIGYRYYDSFSADQLEFVTRAGRESDMVDTKADTYTLRYRWDHPDNDLINLKANLWRTDLRISGRYWDQNTELSYYDLKNHVVTWGGDVGNRMEFDGAIGFLTFDLGADYARENYWSNPNFDSGAFYGTSRANGTRIRRGLHADLTWEPATWLAFSTGFRRDSYEITARSPSGTGGGVRYGGSGNSLKAGVTITPVDGLQLFALYREGLRPPTVRTVATVEETAKTFETGFNIRRDGVFSDADNLGFKAVAFDNRFRNFSTSGIADSAPMETARMRGFELQLNYDSGNFFVEGAFTKYIDIEYCPTTATCSPYAPRNDRDGFYVPPRAHGSLTAGTRLLDERLTLGARMHFAGERWGGVQTTGSGFAQRSYYWHPYKVVDLFGSYSITDSAMVNFSVENVFDKYYVEPMKYVPVPSPGRTARVALTYKF